MTADPAALLRHAADDAPDADLLARFAAGRDERAFALLVCRHGGTVFGVCRRMTGHRQDAEDTFQAVFLLLARKAGRLDRPELLGNWLYGVAVRVAGKARRRASRWRVTGLPELPHTDPPPADTFSPGTPRVAVSPDGRRVLVLVSHPAPKVDPPDPEFERLWAKLADGKDRIDLNDPKNARVRQTMERLVPLPEGGVVTKEMYRGYYARRLGSSRPRGQQLWVVAARVLDAATGEEVSDGRATCETVLGLWDVSPVWK
jgi:DNA-directed RNA polymerase specialized sigma24 family protein